MFIKNLTENQLKSLYCAALGWQFELNKQEKDLSKFDEFYDNIKTERLNDRWIITDGYVQIELLDDLFFRCGFKEDNYEKGGVVFDLQAVLNLLKTLNLIS
jgi:hypothetical protein